MPLGRDSWAAAGYAGAIGSGNTTCGLLIGSCIAVGLRLGNDMTCLPLDDMESRKNAIAEVRALYRDFEEQFNTTQCRTLSGCDFSKPEEVARYVREKMYNHTCRKFFYFVMNRFIEMDKHERDV